MTETLQARLALKDLHRGDHFCTGTQFWLVTDQRQELKSLRLCANLVTGATKWFGESEVVEYYA